MRHPVRSHSLREWSDGRSLHRLGGPAVEDDNGYKEWYWKGDFRASQDSVGGVLYYSNSVRIIFDGDGPFRTFRFPGYKRDEKRRTRR